jgi:outer membrane protein assembly factor BamB/tRNA A-37 threonylcarbamoyl transferase component Bud32
VVDEFSEKRFAVKTIRDESLGDRAAASRFALEARTWLRLDQHDNIVQAMIYREVDDQPLLFLEYVDGTDLNTVAERDRILFVPQAIDFAIQCCRGMDYVHNKDVGAPERGVVHRDLKPHNVMITRRKVAKLTDFGLAKVFGQSTRLTAAGTGMGTYLYMSPEQFADAGSVGKPSDIYSFGVMLYQLVTGRLPIAGDTVANLINNIIKKEPQPPSSVNPNVPKPLGDLILHCIRKRPGERPASFAEIAETLGAIEAELVAQRLFVGQGRLCPDCGYRTDGHFAECVMCDATLVLAADVVSASTTPTAPVTETAPGPETATSDDRDERGSPEADLEEASTQFRHAITHYRSGEFKQALAGLRRALQLDPEHAQAAKGVAELEPRLAQERQERLTASPRLDWPMFRGNPARTGVTPEVLCPPLVERWQVEVGDWVWASPAIAGGVVYVGAGGQEGGNYGRVCALDLLSGSQLWEEKTSYEISSSPTIAQGALFLGMAFDVCALDLQSGSLRWKCSTRQVISTSVAIFGDRAYATSLDGSLYAIHTATGQLVWQYDAGAAIYSSPLAWNNMVCFGCTDHKVHAVDAATGAVRWTYETDGEVNSSPTVFMDTIFVGSGDGNMHAVAMQTGKLRWRYAADDELYSSPAVRQGVVYVGSRDRRLYAIDAVTGEPVWSFETGDWVYSSPAIADDLVYIGSYDRKLYAIDADTGEHVWDVELDGEIRASPAVAHGCVCVGTNGGKLYCYEQQ